ncbi:hypothetical protein GCM10010390_13070 [Streptomyces mordarskii]|uniref:PIN domain-containing protein n=1 Tax=Streptomyces mordarskii TaxID=1226758 RepID=A0ABP3M2C3_9ACTN
MLIVDSGPIVAVLNRNDPDHKRCAELLEPHDGELLITPYVLTEACYLLAKYVGPDAEINLIEAVAAEDLVQAPTARDDLSRIAELMQQYRGFPLGVADASVCADFRICPHGHAASAVQLGKQCTLGPHLSINRGISHG